MNAKICYEIPKSLDDVSEYEITAAVEAVTCEEVKTYDADGEAKCNVTIVDYGVKNSIVSELTKRGCNVKIVPAKTTAEEILADMPDGVLLSNGPGNPADNVGYVDEVAKLFGNVPMFGIGLGHQILALANGAIAYKLKYGHRGGNQPSHNVGTNRTYITSQNNGYAVTTNSLTNGSVSFENANDGTCEGIEYAEAKAFSVQFYPESIEGLHSTSFLYDKFVEMMGGN